VSRNIAKQSNKIVFIGNDRDQPLVREYENGTRKACHSFESTAANSKDG